MTRHPLLLLLLSACYETAEGEGCIDVAEDATSCPDAADVDVADAFVPMDCDNREVVSVSGEGDLGDLPRQVEGELDLVCCYAAEVLDRTPNSDCMVGRPFGTIATAPLPPDPRAAAWAQAGLHEHASVAAFARLALELMHHGAPLDLVRAVLAAADDEVAHAQRCFALAGMAPALGPLPLPAIAARSLADIAADAVREGCLVETLGAYVAGVAADHADDDARDTLAGLAADEARHAALSWRVVAWAIRAGGPDVRTAVRAAFAAPVARLDTTALALRAGLDRAVLDRALASALDEVVTPAARALLAAA
jgi:hypothetical protein